uniref:glutathione-specific gamma-glutamylcyclotransferase n=1 Tax=Glossina palpalis gambiensis TaxID=67801 RepID=A0A1B0BEW8_9MUSC
MSNISLHQIDNIYNELFRKFVEGVETVNVADFQHLNVNKERTVTSENDIWIFGYGSLMWKVDFPYVDCQSGYICGYLRRFYQHSIDHRGTKIKPGRVVTLIKAELTDRVYGLAYRIAVKDKENVLKHLDYREKNGYQRCEVTFHKFPDDSKESTLKILIYIATPGNESWAGEGDEASVIKIAEQIFTSVGPSGTNREYFFNLLHTMLALFPGIKDNHLLEIDNELQRLILTCETKLLERALKKEIALTLHSLGNNIPLNDDAVQGQLYQLIKHCSKVGWREELLVKELYSGNENTGLEIMNHLGSLKDANDDYVKLY